MSDRLSELRRQRALLEQHLAWLDREIAAAESPSAGELAPESGSEPAASAAIPSIPATPAPGPGIARTVPARVDSPTSSGNQPSASLTADAMLDKYRTSPDTVRQDVRKGCLIYFTLAFVILFVAIGILWLAFRS